MKCYESIIKHTKLFSVLMFYLIVSSLLLNFVKSDIPVHCLKSQIVGKWNFYATPAIKKSLSELYNFSCGHQIPSHESTAYKFNQDPSTFTHQFSIDLKDSDEAIYFKDSTTEEDLKGKWTMVYDEGYDIIFNSKNAEKNDRSYFVFSRYGPNSQTWGDIKSKWVSYCYSSLVGWYYIGDQWGCLYGTKEGANKDQITNGEADNKLNVVEGQITQKDSATNQITFLALETQSTLKSESLSQNKERLQLTAKFKDHSKFVERINSMNYMWKAENYAEFSSMTLGELNRFAGRNKMRKHGKHGMKSDMSETFASQVMRFSNLGKNKLRRGKRDNVSSFRQFNNTITEVPKEFSWKDKMSKPRSQGSCGSCYAVSTLSMLEARIRKNYPDLVNKYFSDTNELSLSSKHALKCSVYNQGCDGGYAYLVMKFFNEFEMLLDKCYDRSSCGKKCKDANLEKLQLSVKNYHYIGGSYGKCSEEAILNEVYQNGPIVVSFEPDYSFMFYKSGIYFSPNNNWMTNNLSKPEWQKVDHSVVLVGWGEEIVEGKAVKYWLLQNSWGSNWGENGYFKLMRGVDHLGIESICEAAEPIFKEKTNSFI